MKLYILKKLIKNKTLMKYLIALSIYNYLSMNIVHAVDLVIKNKVFSTNQ